MQPKHRILIVSNFYPPNAIGGAEVVAARQARAFCDAGHSVSVFAGGLPQDGLEAGALEREWDHNKKIPVFRNGLVSLDTGENFFRHEVARRFGGVLRHFEPSIVHFHNVVGLGANLIPLAKSYGAKVFVTFHDHWGFCFKNTRLRNDLSLCTNPEECARCKPKVETPLGGPLPMRLRRDYVAWCLGHADRLLSPSHYLANAYDEARTLTKPVQALSNGIDLEVLESSTSKLSEPKSEDHCTHFLCAAYLGAHKGIVHLLNAAEKLANNRNLKGRWRLTICGHGELSEDIQSGIRAGRFGDAVELAGRLPRSELLELMDRVDAIVLPSIWPENEPVSMLEAIAKGKAQIATRTGGNIDLVEDGLSGFLVEPGDDADLAAAMARLIQDPGLSRNFGERNRQRRAQFSETHTIRRLQTLYNMPSTPRLQDEYVVACAGPAPNPDLDDLLHMFHVVEGELSRVRFVFHDWLDTCAWERLDLVWIWPGFRIEEAGLVLRAVRSGIPVLAETNSPLAGFSVANELPPYATLSDALGTIAALAELPPVPPMHPSLSATLARRLTTLLPQASFNLSSEIAK